MSVLCLLVSIPEQSLSVILARKALSEAGMQEAQDPWPPTAGSSALPGWFLFQLGVFGLQNAVASENRPPLVKKKSVR